MLVRMLIALLVTSTFACAQDAKLTYRTCARLSDRRIVGLSGITRAGDSDTYWGVMDSGPTLVRLAIRIKADGSIASADSTAFLPISSRLRDLEGIAFTGARHDSVIVSDETGPGLTEVSLKTGKTLQFLPVPNLFRSFVANQGFESCTISPDGRSLWTANERALKIDGNPQTQATPILSQTRVRLMRYEIDHDKYTPRGQFEYDTSGVHDWGGQIGLCDLAALPDGRLLALERSAAMNFSGGKSIRTRIFLVDPAGATDISKPPFGQGLVNQSPVKVKKTALFDGFVCSEHGENLEGLCLGPRLGKNRFAVLGTFDNTDGPLHLSKSSVVSFELQLKPPP
jgi:hypothetical protein